MMGKTNRVHMSVNQKQSVCDKSERQSNCYNFDFYFIFLNMLLKINNLYLFN